MKKIAIALVLALLSNIAANAQIIQKPMPEIKRVPIAKSVPASDIPLPTSVNKTTPDSNQFIPIYNLTAAKVNIRTGNDNKEYPSNVIVTLGARGSSNVHCYFKQSNLKNEMKGNSNTEFGLEKFCTNPGQEMPLQILQIQGLYLKINYLANFKFDAWKIENIAVTIEFRDQNGNLHPTLAQKTITFSNANGFLNGYDGIKAMVCTTDGYFNPLSANIQ